MCSTRFTPTNFPCASIGALTMESNHTSDKMNSGSSQNDSTPLSLYPVIIVEEYENKPLKQKCENLQHKAVNIMAEFSRLKEEAEVNKETIKFQAETNDTLKADKAKRVDENSKLKEDHAAETARLETSLTAALTEKQEIIIQQDEIIEEGKSEIAQLKENIQVNDTVPVLLNSLEMSEKKAEISALKSTHDAKEAEIQAEINRLNNLQISITDIEGDKAKLENQISRFTETRDAKETELQGEINRLNNEITSLQTSNRTLEEDKTKLEYELAQSKNTTNAKEAEINRLNNELGTLQTSLGNSVASNSQLQDDKDALQQQCNDEKYALNAKVCEKDQKIKNLESEARQMQNQINELTEANAFINAPICKIDDVVVNGQVDSERLNGKLLVVEFLEYKRNGRMNAGGFEVSLEDTDFKIYVQNTFFIKFDNFFICNSIVYNNIKALGIYDSTDTYATWKKLISSCSNLTFICINNVTVKDENDTVVEIDQLWKDILEKSSNIEHLFYGFKNNEYSSTVAQKLCQLSPFPNITDIALWDIQEGFNLLCFNEFIRKNPNATYNLSFSGSNEFKSKIRCAERKLRRILPSTCKFDIVL